MKKIFTFIALSLFLFLNNVKAASLCSYEDQMLYNAKAANIKVNYEISYEVMEFEDMPVITEYYNISIFNIPKELYVVVKNNINGEEKKFTYNDTEEGIVSFEWNYFDDITNFTIEVYTSELSTCPYEKYKTLYLTTPRFNEFYNREICQDNSDFYLCQKYVVFKDVDDTKFLEELSSYKNGTINDDGEKVDNEKLGLTDKIFNFINDYKWYISGGLLIILTCIIVIHRARTKKQRDLGL